MYPSRNLEVAAHPLCHIPEWCFPWVEMLQLCTCSHTRAHRYHMSKNTTYARPRAGLPLCPRSVLVYGFVTVSWHTWKDNGPRVLIITFLTSHGMEGWGWRFLHFPGFTSYVLNYSLLLLPPDLVCLPASKLELIITDSYRIFYSWVLKKKKKKIHEKIQPNNTSTTERVMEKPQNCTGAMEHLYITCLHKLNWHKRIKGHSIKTEF